MSCSLYWWYNTENYKLLARTVHNERLNTSDRGQTQQPQQALKVSFGLSSTHQPRAATYIRYIRICIQFVSHCVRVSRGGCIAFWVVFVCLNKNSNVCVEICEWTWMHMYDEWYVGYMYSYIEFTSMEGQCSDACILNKHLRYTELLKKYI